MNYVQEQIIMNWHDTRLRKMLMTLSESLDEKGYLAGKSTELLKEYRPTKIEIADCLTLFKVIRIFKPNLQDCRDMTLFKDKDKAYLIASSDGNKTLRVTELTADYTNVTRNSYKLFIDQEREAPTIFHTKDWYFMITSGCTGWSPNPALYSRSHALLTGQKLINNPCVGPESDKTFLGQPTYIFEVNGNFYLMLDHWKKDNLCDSGYSILPIKIEGRDLRIDWSEELPKF